MTINTIRTRFLGTLLTVALPIAASLMAGCGSDSNNTAGSTGSAETSTSSELVTGTGTGSGIGPSSVVLGTAGNFVILAKSGISTVPPSVVTGDIGVSPIDSTAITGFSLVADASNLFSKSSQVTGKVYSANYTAPTPANMTTAISNMQTAYTDAAGRSNPDFTEQFAGNLGGKTLAPGLYKWGTSVNIPTDVTLNGGSDDVWIFQISGNLTMDAAKSVILIGGAQAENIVWQVAGAVSIGATSHFEGIVLCATAITLKTGSSINGILLAQTAVNLQSATLTHP